jgi:PPK2 family polyphosphate:nucleotide phosphotransferase
LATFPEHGDIGTLAVGKISQSKVGVRKRGARIRRYSGRELLEGETDLMKRDKLIDRSRKLARRYQIKDGKSFRLADADPGDTAWLKAEDKPESKEVLQQGVEVLAELQDRLYAQDCWGLLLIFQAMDAAGKDGAIKHVMSGINPQGCQVVSFKAPSAEDLDHDFLWRCARALPERGRIGILNRSYYEEVLVVRVHEGLLRKQKLPSELITKDIWNDRFRDIRGWERYLAGNGVVVRKFFLNVSRAEQKRRFLERIERPEKNWKFSATDAQERGYWKDYMSAYEDLIRNTATKHAPWYVVPADNKWFTRIVVAAVVIDTLSSLGLQYPKVGKEKLAELARVRKALRSEK